MEFNCVGGPGVAGEKAFNAYRSAYSTWNDCVSDFDCDNDAINPELQKQWSKASRQITRARSALSDLEAQAATDQDAYEKQKKKARQAEAALK